MRESYDVVVIGGGAAGIPAAIQAARAGAATLLVEKNGILGGTMTAGGTCHPALFHAWGRQVIAGIGWELVQRTVREAGETLPDFTKAGPRQNSHTIYTSFPLFAALADEGVREAGAELLLHAMLASAEFAGGEWRLALCTKTGLRPVRAKALIDASGDASAVQIAGFPVRRHDTLQPGTLLVRASGYDAATLDYAAIQAAFDREVAAGRMKDSDFGWGRPRVNGFLRSYGGNTNHVCPIDGTTSESRTEAEVAARETLLRIYRFLRAQKGLEGLRIDWIAAEVGIRETVTIRGKKTITLEDYCSGRVWEDAVCHSFYPIDLHMVEGFDFRPLPEGVVPTIPRGAMLPEGSRFLLAPGRHMSGDRLAHSAYRVQATCMASGQAAGALAALSAKTGRDPEELDLAEVRALLKKHGAIVPQT